MANRTITKTVNTPNETKIFIGCNSLTLATRLCVEYCTQVGLCVTVTPTIYCYRDGYCDGIVVGLINYPRFPASRSEIWAKAMNLATYLKKELGQGSFTVQNDKVATFVSDRDEDQ